MSEQNFRRWLLLTIALAMLMIWGWVLPWVGQLTEVRSRIDQSQRMGINPAAIYYTDVFLPPSGPTPQGETK